jgi:8-oxo-dGTP pyrophosphatase MutT (NUDIX family)
MKRPRSSVKAIIFHEHQLATIAKRDEEGEFYSFPGGGQKVGETLGQAVVREVREETGWHIAVGDLLIVREYIGKHHEFAAEDAKEHVVDHLFLCTLADPTTPVAPAAPDKDQVGIIWLPVDELGTYRFYPRTLIPHLVEMSRIGRYGGPIYVGDVN